MLDKFFKLSEKSTTVKTEILAGVTTFLAMAYILAVNPAMLGETGMSVQGVFLATAIASAVATIIMGLVANYPVALSAGMGVNALFTYTICFGMGLSYKGALACVFVSGIIFLVISITGIRTMIINAIPAQLKLAIGAGLMLTNPNTVGIFDKNILEITKIIHDAGGLCYYDGANLNAVMGVVRPGDMGFDCIHLNLHKSFATPHGGGGPGSGPVGCKAFLAPFLPGPIPEKTENGFRFAQPAQSVGRVRDFYGNFLVVVKAFAYLTMLGREGVHEVGRNAVLNANYMMAALQDIYDMAYPGPCMHEFVMTLDRLHKETGVSALDIAKGLLDNGIHPPTMYFPLIVHEALMVEPTETESKATMDEAIEVFRSLARLAYENPEALHTAPHNTPVRRLDEVQAARNPVLRAVFAE